MTVTVWQGDTPTEFDDVVAVGVQLPQQNQRTNCHSGRFGCDEKARRDEHTAMLRIAISAPKITGFRGVSTFGRTRRISTCVCSS